MRRFLTVSVGEVLGRLTVESEPTKQADGRKWVQCRCSCGALKSFAILHLKRKKSPTRSCGCLYRESIGQRSRTHGDSSRLNRDRLYRIWAAMKTRCCNENAPQYADYGGRGIRVHVEWKKYDVFREWAMTNGYKDGLTIERKDVNGDYSPSNCTWIPGAEQAHNRRDSVRITAFGETKSLPVWLKDNRCKVKKSTTLRDRIATGWAPEDAIRLPVGAVKRGPKPKTSGN